MMTALSIRLNKKKLSSFITTLSRNCCTMKLLTLHLFFILRHLFFTLHHLVLILRHLFFRLSMCRTLYETLDGRFVYSNRRVISGFHYVVVTLCGCLGEFQFRGSPHVHCFIWVKDAPLLTRETKQEYIDFIDSIVRVDLPDKDTEPELNQLVSKYQSHCHS